MKPPSAAHLRLHARRKRASLSTQQQLVAARNLARHANSALPMKAASLVLSYLPLGGEICPKQLHIHFPKASFLLPRISHFQHNTMQFFPADSRTLKNRYGIQEPAPISPPVAAQRIDVVLVPLVAFDRQGNRIGMGGGFYDRAFEFRRRSVTRHKPLLVGLAHHCQEVNSIQPEVWDVPLDVIITDQEVIYPN